MTIRIGNAPCSWGVEFAGDPRNPGWKDVIRENAEAGYTGIELGPVGFMPEDPPQVADALAEHGQHVVAPGRKGGLVVGQVDDGGPARGRWGA